MSIRPPSDIVLNVAMAADPVRAAGAARKLVGAAPPAFAAALDAPSSLRASPADTLAALSHRRAGQAAPSATPAGAMPKALRDLETFFLRTAFDGMLPAGSHVSGPAGAGAGLWKSMLSEALAGQVAASGGLHVLDGARAASGPGGAT